MSTRRANELGAIHEGNSNDHGFANEGFQGFRDSSGFGLWGGGNESVDGTTTIDDDDDQRRDHLDDDDDEEEHDSCE